MRGYCVSKRPLRFWQYQPTVEQVPAWVAVHARFNGKTDEVRVTLSPPGDDEWVLDPGDFVVDRPGGTPYVLSDAEFRQMFEICPEQAR